MRVLLSVALLCSCQALRIGGGSAQETEAAPPLGRGKEAAADSPAVKRQADSASEQVAATDEAHGTITDSRRLLVVGSLNLDVIMEVDRLPRKGENVVARRPDATTALGGKGANQAIAVARLTAGGEHAGVDFVCQFGNDAHAAQLERTLVASGVGLSACGRSVGSGSGQGFVFLEPDGGVAAVVLGGANEAGWGAQQARALESRVRAASALLLQREIPEEINEILAGAAKAAGVPVLLDIGGAERPLSDAMLALVDYVCPNESELERLTGMPTSGRAEVLAAARSLRARGARNVLVTLGAEGSVLLTSDDQLIEQPPLAIPGGRVVDATGAGDAFRAAFAVALTDRWPLAQCMRFAAAAGAVAVSRLGAEPSLPTRAECEAVLAGKPLPPRADAPSASAGAPATAAAAAEGSASLAGSGTEMTGAAPTNGGAHAAAAKAAGPRAIRLPPSRHGTFDEAAWRASEEGGVCPLQFGSRLNSMSARKDLWEGATDTLGLVARQGTVAGLGLVDFNFPQHLRGVAPEQARAALERAGLKAGAICMRYEREHQLGALTHPDPELRRKAIEMTIEGGRYALQLGANELVVWSAFDGYDYHHQVDYVVLWGRVVDAFQQVCDALPDVRVSLEFKPTDENTRFFAVPSTGAALLLAQQVDRPNFGLTLDIGHMLMAGENPAQSVALVGHAGKLFGVQLNDGHAKMGAEDGLMFGSVHGSMALEFLRWLQKVRFDGHIYFDTFPRNEDPVREAEYNIRRVKALWKQAARLTAAGLDGHLARHDALAALELMETELEGQPAPGSGA